MLDSPRSNLSPREAILDSFCSKKLFKPSPYRWPGEMRGAIESAAPSGGSACWIHPPILQVLAWLFSLAQCSGQDLSPDLILYPSWGPPHWPAHSADCCTVFALAEGCLGRCSLTGEVICPLQRGRAEVRGLPCHDVIVDAMICGVALWRRSARWRADNACNRNGVTEMGLNKVAQFGV